MNIKQIDVDQINLYLSQPFLYLGMMVVAFAILGNTWMITIVEDCKEGTLPLSVCSDVGILELITQVAPFLIFGFVPLIIWAVFSPFIKGKQKKRALQ